MHILFSLAKLIQRRWTLVIIKSCQTRSRQNPSTPSFQNQQYSAFTLNWHNSITPYYTTQKLSIFSNGKGEKNSEKDANYSIAVIGASTFKKHVGNQEYNYYNNISIPTLPSCRNDPATAELHRPRTVYQNYNKNSKSKSVKHKLQITETWDKTEQTFFAGIPSNQKE